MKFLLALSLPLYALDQATKWWIIHRSGGVLGWEEEIVPGFFKLCDWGNTGAAFSLGKDNNTFFIALSLATLAGLLIATARGVFRDVGAAGASACSSPAFSATLPTAHSRTSSISALRSPRSCQSLAGVQRRRLLHLHAVGCFLIATILRESSSRREARPSFGAR